MDIVLLTVSEAGRRIGLSASRVRKLADAGALRSVRIGERRARFFTPEAIERLIEMRAAKQKPKDQRD